jgi:hypothetical protein
MGGVDLVAAVRAALRSWLTAALSSFGTSLMPAAAIYTSASVWMASICSFMGKAGEMDRNPVSVKAKLWEDRVSQPFRYLS